MTVSTTAFSQVVAGTGAATVFNFSFAVEDENDIEVIYTDADGNQTPLASSAYTAFINAPAAGQLYGIGGTITYNPGSPIAFGTTLTISRVVSLVQQTSISNQGAFYPQVIERAMDNLCFEIQQVSGRSGALRGSWATDVEYNYADIVQDGTNGTNTQNYYICIIANTSGVWADDLASGYWSLAINIQQTAQYAEAAADSADEAAASATDASDSANSAATSAASALSSASDSAAILAANQVLAENVSTAETNSLAFAVSAFNSMTAAGTSANDASTSASAAATSASSASTYASNASTSATNAAASAVSAAASASQAAGTLIGTSTTSNSVATGSKSFTTQTGLALGVGGFITVADTATPANYMHGQVTSYSGTSLVVNVLDTGGSGTHTAWTITTSSPQGPAGGGGSGTVNASTAGYMTYYASSSDAVSGNANVRVSSGALTLGTASSVQGSLVLSGSTSGTTTVAAPVAGTGTMTLQAGSDTLTGRATTDTLTNKTVTASSNVLGGVTMTLGSDAVGDVYYRNGSGVLTRLALGSATTILHGGASAPAFSAVVENDITLTDVTTNNVSSTKHGFSPKSPADATYFLNGAATPAYAQIKDSDLSITDITTNDATASAHGFCPKLSGTATTFLNGIGTFTSPSSSGGLINVQVFVNSGTWTKPAGTVAVEAIVVGGGGGGGGADNSSTTGAPSAAGGGGGGGGYSYKYITSALGATETVTIGAAGAAGANTGGNGGTGGTSSFGSHCTASGGVGGVGAIAAASVIAVGTGGAGGAGASGTLNAEGADGAGGAAFTENSNLAFATGGIGGGSCFASGGAGAAAVVTTAGFTAFTAGSAGNNYGGGGGGAICIDSTSGSAGGAGAKGVIIVKSYS